MGSASTNLAFVLAAGAWDVRPGVGFIVLVFALAGVGGLGWVWLSTAPSRVAAGLATMELRDETPALVDLLTGGFQVEDDAVPATVVDLAARQYVEIDEIGERVTIRRRREGAAPVDALTAYERRVLTHIEQQAVDGVVPAEVITIGPEGVSERWFRGFVREVNQHGQSLGLCRRRLDLKHLVITWGIVVIAVAPAVLVGGTGRRTTNPRGWGTVGNLMVGLAFLAAALAVWIAQRISRSNAQHDTAAGREAAAHWLGVRDHYRGSGGYEDKPAASVAIWERHLAYATAMGLAPVVQRQLPFETEHDRHAWSRVTGHWRRVKVRYQSFVPSWGESPISVALGGLVQAAVAGFIAYGAYYVASGDLDLGVITDDQRRWVGLGGLVIAALAAGACAFSLAKVVLGASDLFARRTIEGEVVRARIHQTGHRLPKLVQMAMYRGHDEYGRRRDARRRTRHHVAIDTGDGDSVVANVVRAKIYQQVMQGARVRAVVTPRLGYVRSIEMLAAPRPSAASAPTVHHELVEDTVKRAGSKLAGSMSGALAGLEQATDKDGRPILDQTDEEGVSLRDRFAQSTAQLDQVRNDPRLKNSPIGGLLDAFLSPEPANAPAVDPDGAESTGIVPESASRPDSEEPSG